MEGRISIIYREIIPKPGSMLVQMLTYPWKAIKVAALLPVDVDKIS